MTLWSFSSSFVAPRFSFGFHILVFYPALIQTMTIYSTVVAVSFEAFSFSSFAGFSSFEAFKRHQLFLDLVQSDRRVITPCLLFLVLGSSSTSVIVLGFWSVARFVLLTFLQRSHLGKHCINFHGNRFVLFSFVVKNGRPF